MLHIVFFFMFKVQQTSYYYVCCSFIVSHLVKAKNKNRQKATNQNKKLPKYEMEKEAKNQNCALLLHLLVKKHTKNSEQTSDK